MKKRLNSVFFGVCFLAALLAEAYSFIVLEGDLLNSIGFGLVVLITGYLLFTEIRNSFYDKKNKLSYYVDRIIFEELESLKSRLNDSANVQKATYSATKKNTEIIKEQLQEIVNRLDTLESSNSSGLYLIAELQRRSLEGQKKALNIELNYNRESTKQLLEALNSEGKQTEIEHKLAKIINLLEQRDELLWNINVDSLKKQNPSNNTEFVEEAAASTESLEKYSIPKEQEAEEQEAEEQEAEEQDVEDQDVKDQDVKDQDVIEASGNINNIEVFEKEFELPQDVMEDLDITKELEQDSFLPDKTENVVDVLDDVEENSTIEEPEDDNNSTIIPLYDDPNKALSADEIAALFESYSK